MKNLIYTLIIGVSLFLASCNNNDEYEILWYNYGTYLKSDSLEFGFLIEFDDGKQLIPTDVVYVSDEVVDSSRVFVLYSIISEEYETVNASVKEVSEILTKGVMQLTEENQDSIGNDGIIILEEDIWFSEDHLNVIFGYFGLNAIHYINLVKPIDNQFDEYGRQILEFRHNANNDYPSYFHSSIVSFDMWSLYEDGMDSINFVFKSTDYDSTELNWEGTYFFNNNNTTKKSRVNTPVNFKKVY